MTDQKPESTPAPEKRDTSTDEPVTELATVDGGVKDKDMKAMAGITGKPENASEQQRHAYEGLQMAAGKRDKPEVNPHIAGPGSDIA